MILADFLLPVSGSVSLKRIRIRLTGFLYLIYMSHVKWRSMKGYVVYLAVNLIHTVGNAPPRRQYRLDTQLDKKQNLHRAQFYMRPID